MSAHPEEIGWDDFTSWAPAHLSGGLDERVGIFADLAEEPDDGDGADTYAQVAEALEPVVGSHVTAKHIDPSVGAGSFGVAAFWEIISQGADLLAWATVAVQAAPKLRNAARRLSALVGYSEDESAVTYSPAALRVLVLADAVKRHGLDPASLADVQMLRHTYEPVEPREELRHLYAAYTVTVSAFVDGFFSTWVYVVTPDARIVSETRVRVPVPNRTHWYDVDVAGRSLMG